VSVTVEPASTDWSGPAFALAGTGVSVVEVVGVVVVVLVLVDVVEVLVVVVLMVVVAGVVVGRAIVDLAVAVGVVAPPPDRATTAIVPANRTSAATMLSPSRYFGCIGPGCRFGGNGDCDGGGGEDWCGGTSDGVSGSGGTPSAGPKGVVTASTVVAGRAPPVAPAGAAQASVRRNRSSDEITEN